MDEAKWLTSNNPAEMLAYIDPPGDNEAWRRRPRLINRKTRLFVVACCRRVWHILTDERSRSCLETAERYTDGQATDEEFSEATTRVREFAMAETARSGGSPTWLVFYAGFSELDTYSIQVMLQAFNVDSRQWERQNWPGPFPAGPGETVRPVSKRVQADILRDIIGNPFRPAQPMHPGITPEALSLATAAYVDRTPHGYLDPVRLAILSDALEEAGVTDDALLSHLRSPEPHARGCWALDIVLGR